MTEISLSYSCRYDCELVDFYYLEQFKVPPSPLFEDKLLWSADADEVYLQPLGPKQQVRLMICTVPIARHQAVMADLRR